MSLKVIGILLVMTLLMSVTTSRQNENITIFMIGDSTMANKPYINGNPEKGWGQVFGLYFKDGIRVDNHAVNGRSSKSFINEGRWDRVKDLINPGDYVIIQFGHNDQKENSPDRYAAPQTEYRHNLLKFIVEARELGAHPVLATPIVRRRFDEHGQFYDTHGSYPEVVREVSKEMDVPLLDLHKKTRNLLINYGAVRSKTLFLHIPSNEYPSLKEDLSDDTHLSPTGAFRVCDLAIEEIRNVIPEMRKYIKE